MIKGIDLAKRISKQLGKNWLPELQDINLHTIFTSIYALNQNVETLNTIVSYVIFAYDNDSNWIDLKLDRIENKEQILKGIGANLKEEIYQSLISLDVSDIEDVCWSYLELQPNWKFRTIITCFEYHAKNIRSATEKISPLITDDLEIAKINKAKGELIKEAIRNRNVGEELLKELRTEYVKLDHITQSEFGFTATDIEKTDYTSWRSRLQKRLNKV